MRAQSVVLFTTLCIGAALTSCSDPKPEPGENLVEAYSEILIASNLHREDSVQRITATDSIAAHFGYNDHKKVLAEIHEMALDPEVLRKVLDSTQNRLQSLQEALNAKGLK